MSEIGKRNSSQGNLVQTDARNLSGGTESKDSLSKGPPLVATVSNVTIRGGERHIVIARRTAACWDRRLRRHRQDVRVVTRDRDGHRTQCRFQA